MTLKLTVAFSLVAILVSAGTAAAQDRALEAQGLDTLKAMWNGDDHTVQSNLAPNIEIVVRSQIMLGCKHGTPIVTPFDYTLAPTERDAIVITSPLDQAGGCVRAADIIELLDPQLLTHAPDITHRFTPPDDAAVHTMTQSAREDMALGSTRAVFDVGSRDHTVLALIAIDAHNDRRPADILVEIDFNPDHLIQRWTATKVFYRNVDEPDEVSPS